DLAACQSEFVFVYVARVAGMSVNMPHASMEIGMAKGRTWSCARRCRGARGRQRKRLASLPEVPAAARQAGGQGGESGRQSETVEAVKAELMRLEGWTQWGKVFGAGDGTRTRDVQLGKLPFICTLKTYASMVLVLGHLTH